MVSPDPVDMRLLALLAESGRAAPVHEIAARAGIDPREAASRLVSLSASGLPLIVGVEFDANGLRGALAAAGAWAGFPPPQTAPPQPPQPQPQPGYGPGYGPHGTPSGPYNTPYGTPSGAYGTPSGPYGTPSGPYGTPSGPYPPPPPTGPYPPPPGYPAGPPSGSFPAQAPPPMPPQAPVQPPAAQPYATPGADPMSTWGPPQSAAWVRGDQPTVVSAPAAATGRTGVVGGSMEAEGLEGERLVIQLVEVVDPADFLFTAAGYRLQEGERAVVVHTELHNKGPVPFASLPDLYLVLLTEDGQPVSKAPVGLSSRPPHRIGVAPGETAGGHTVYVLPESQRITRVRWSPHPDDEARSLTWTVED
ncbi:hypothetical protein JOF53_002524 [Crossiella equi]|uniref:AsnC family protein n=1 Tax=Crossiella equi TaxID=130796 RepID=A0ABS5ABI8_9PSEU|nr:AsnC family protein [Crossiella equi]MBP2473652.1 hypothetical protein [Crossiella equi]